MTQTLQILEAVASAVIGIVGIFAAAKIARHEFRQTGLSLLQDLTTGEVATARNITGTFMYGSDAQIRELTNSDLVREYYVLLWAIERNSEGYRALASSRQRRIARDFRSSVNWHVVEVVQNLAVLHWAMGYSDDQAWARLREAIDVLGLSPITREEAVRLAAERSLQRKVTLLADVASPPENSPMLHRFLRRGVRTS